MKMLKVIIIDDESKICQMIVRIVDWENLGFEIVATSNNGLEGLELIKKYRPDVVITDVRMPGLDGIGLVTAVQKECGDIGIDFIIISGYKHFEYAYNAIKQGVEYYLLKPIDEDELIDILVKIRNRRTDLQEHQSHQADLESEIAQNRESLRNRLLTFLYLNTGEFTMALDEVNKQFCTNFKQGCYQCFIMKCDQHTVDYNGERTLLAQKILETINLVYSPYAIDMIAKENSCGIICLINFAACDKPIIKECHNKFFEQSKRRTYAFAGYSQTLGLGSIATELLYIQNSLNEAIMAIKSRVIFGTGRILTYTPSHAKNSVKLLPYKAEVGLASAIEGGNREAMISWFADMTSKVLGIKGFNMDMLSDIIDNMTDAITNVLKRLPGLEFKKELYLSELHDKLCDAYSVELLIAGMRDHLLSLLAQYDGNRSREHNHSITLAKEYIQNNYMQQIKLEDVSNYVNYSETYFSGVFKQYVEMNFSEYLTKIRIEAAKDLLRSSKLSILKIANEVGYRDEKHFSKLFRKTVGIRPTEYRKLYS